MLKALAIVGDSGAVLAGVGVMSESAWDEWPRCAACGRQRPTVCPVCGEAGTRFAPARPPLPGAPLLATRDAGQPGTADALGDDDPLMVCPQCDSVFVPQYYRYCAWCGEDAGSGREVPGGHRERLSSLGLWIVLATGGLLTLLLWYFHWLFRR
jgi:hypothetical protein